MSTPLSFKKNFSWTLVGQACNVLAQFVIVIAISRFSNVETVGLYGIITAIVSPVQLFLKLDLGKLLVTSDDFDRVFPYYHTVAVVMSFLVPLVSVVVCMIIYQDTSIILIVLSFALYRSLLNYREFCYAVYQRFERMDYMGKSLMSLSLFTIVLFLGTFYLTKSLFISFLVVSFQYAISLFLFETARMKRFFKTEMSLFAYDKKEIKAILKKGLPMGGTAAATSFKTNIPRYLIEFVLRDRELLGFYTAFLQILNSVGYLNQAMAKTSIGKLSNLYHKSHESFMAFLKKMLLASTGVAVFALVLSILFGTFFNTLLFGESYGAHNYILILLFVSKVFVMPTTYLKIVQLIVNQINSQFVIMVLGMTVLAALGFLLIPSLSDIGILIALIVSELFILLATAFVAFKKLSYVKEG